MPGTNLDAINPSRALTVSAVAQTRPGDEFSGDHHVYEPHKVGLPPIGPYFRALWARRQFLYELARTNLRAQHFNTTLGQLWLILNPVMLGSSTSSWSTSFAAADAGPSSSPT